MALGIGVLGVKIAADDFQSSRIHRHREGDGIVGFIRLARPVGIHQHFIGDRRQGRQRSQPAHHRAGVGFADNVQNQIRVLLFTRSLERS